MNFYKHHLGDYAAATVHLSWDEDCAYRRLMEQYYKREAPIPRDVKEACRLARATTPAQRRAVESVLREFFIEQDDGWHQKRCDEEITAANNQAETNRRIAEEREAKKRARTEHESFNGSGNGSSNEPSTNRPPDTTGERAESVNLSRLQTPDSTSQTPEDPPVVPPPSPKRASAEARAARLPTDWVLTPERLQIAEAEHVDPERTFAKFTDYWHAAGGQNSRKRNWDAAWRNWCRTEADRKPNGSNGSYKAPAPLKLRTADEIEAEERARGDWDAQH